VKKVKNEWDAVILAEYGPETKFNIDLKGTATKGKVVFGGTLNLGEEQGIFHLVGDGDGERFFRASTKGRAKNGVFRMTRVDSAMASKPTEQPGTAIEKQ